MRARRGPAAGTRLTITGRRRARVPAMATDIRPLDEVDIDDVVELSVAAWAPVFASIERQLAGSGVYEVLHPDWAAGQRRAVETACRDPKTHVWVATVDGEVAGFVAVVVHLDVSVGEIH